MRRFVHLLREGLHEPPSERVRRIDAGIGPEQDRPSQLRVVADGDLHDLNVLEGAQSNAGAQSDGY